MIINGQNCNEEYDLLIARNLNQIKSIFSKLLVVSEYDKKNHISPCFPHRYNTSVLQRNPDQGKS